MAVRKFEASLVKMVDYAFHAEKASMNSYVDFVTYQIDFT
jgi:hypothetical protein